MIYSLKNLTFLSIEGKAILLKSALVLWCLFATSIVVYSQDKNEFALGLSFNPATYTRYSSFSLDGVGWGGGIYSQFMITERFGIETNPQWRVNPLQVNRSRCSPSYCEFTYREHNLTLPLNLTLQIVNTSRFCTAISLHAGYSLEFLYTKTTSSIPDNYSGQNSREEAWLGGRDLHYVQAGIRFRFPIGRAYAVGWGGQFMAPLSTYEAILFNDLAPVLVFNLRLLRIL